MLGTCHIKHAVHIPWLRNLSPQNRMETNTNHRCSWSKPCPHGTTRGAGPVSPVSTLSREIPVIPRPGQQLLMLTLLLLLCALSTSAHRVDKLQFNDAKHLDSVQRAEQKQDKNSADTHAKHQGGFGSTPLCKPGHTEPHFVYSCKYTVCSQSLEHPVTRNCPRGKDYDKNTGQCSIDEPRCNDDTKNVFRIIRTKRALEDENAGSGSNTVTESEDPGPGPDDSGSGIPPTAVPETPDSGVTVVEAGQGGVVTSTSTPETSKHPTTQQAKMSTGVMATNATGAPTTAEQTTTATTVKATTQEIVIPGDPDTPPYVIITEPPSDVTTTKNMTVIEPADKSAKTGAIIGIIVALVAVVVIIVVIIVLVKKKKINVGSAKLPVKRKKKIVTRMENPQYGHPQTYRFSSDSTLQVGTTSATLTKFNNPNLGDTPLPKVLQTDSPGRQRQGSLPRSIASRRDKRKAPAPPNPFGDFVDADQDELYEKASHGSMELQTFTVQNENATEADDNDNEPSYPLLKKGDKDTADKGSSLDNGKVKKARAPPAPDTPGGADDSLIQNADKRKSSASQDKASVDFTMDEYDLTNNPFFSKTND